MKTKALALKVFNAAVDYLENGKDVAFVGDLSKNNLASYQVIRSMVSSTSIAPVMIVGLNNKVLKEVKRLAVAYQYGIAEESGLLVIWNPDVDRS